MPDYDFGSFHPGNCWPEPNYGQPLKPDDLPECRLFGHHEYTIPVEWEYFIEWEGGRRHPTALQSTGGIPPAYKTVTKLRCACGEEVDR